MRDVGSAATPGVAAHSDVAAAVVAIAHASTDEIDIGEPHFPSLRPLSWPLSGSADGIAGESDNVVLLVGTTFGAEENRRRRSRGHACAE